jgi:hypothetical protein
VLLVQQKAGPAVQPLVVPEAQLFLELVLLELPEMPAQLVLVRPAVTGDLHHLAVAPVEQVQLRPEKIAQKPQIVAACWAEEAEAAASFGKYLVVLLVEPVQKEGLLAAEAVPECFR